MAFPFLHPRDECSLAETLPEEAKQLTKQHYQNLKQRFAFELHPLSWGQFILDSAWYSKFFKLSAERGDLCVHEVACKCIVESVLKEIKLMTCLEVNLA